VTDVLRELLLLLAIAAAGVAVFERLRLPGIAGFLVMGALLGPGGLGLARDPERIRGLAEFGVVFLLFEIGLELPVDALRRLGRAAVVGGGLQMVLTVGAVAAAASALGLATPAALALGGLVAMSSTALVMRLLADRGETDAPHGRLAIAILLFQDLCIVPMLLGLPILAGVVPAEPAPVALALGKAALALAVLFLVARFALPWLLGGVAKLRSPDLFSLLAFVLVIGSAVAAERMGLTLAVGAFSAGLVLASSPYSHQVLAEIAPLRGVLLGMFFTAVGMLFDPRAAFDAGPALGLYVGAVVVVKASIVFAIAVLALREGARVGVLTALALAQTGEFSFVLAERASRAGILDPTLLQVFLAGSGATLVATPFLVAGAPWLAQAVARRAERLALGPIREPARHPRALLVGFGLGGHTVARALRACGVPYTVIEANARAVAAGRATGEPILFGDATRPTLLEHAGVREARLVAVAISDPLATRRVTSLVRRLAPEAFLVVRTRYMVEMDALYTLGASVVVAEEFEATLDLVGAVLRSLGVPSASVQRFTEELRGEGYEALRRPPELLLDPWLEEVLHDVATQWVEVSPTAAGRSIAELAVRTRTGASVVALRRGGDTRVNPSPDERLAAGDRLLAVGDAAALGRLRELVGTEA
jgi:CPA2 family monovalent cation:H+ antiporter-2